MKIEINTETKTIVILEAVKLDELSSFLQDVFPHGVWKEYSVISNVVYTETKVLPTRNIPTDLHPPYIPTIQPPNPYQYPNNPPPIWYVHAGTDPYTVNGDGTLSYYSNINKADERNTPSTTPDGGKLF